MDGKGVYLPIGADNAYLLDLYSRYKRDRYSVPIDLSVLFDSLEMAEEAVGDGAQAAPDLATRLFEQYRAFGHYEARLDPLGAEVPSFPALDALRDAVSTMADRVVSLTIAGRGHSATLSALDAELRAIYTGHSAIEASHIVSDAERGWLYDYFEANSSASPDTAFLTRTLEAILLVDEFERFLKTKFVGKKRFGIEGAESVIAFLRELLFTAAQAGVTDVVMGGMHRGRLATLATVLGKPFVQIMAEIKGRDTTQGGPASTGDVPYHLGYAGELSVANTKLAVSISPHPSHLITVAPVTLGPARARRAEPARKTLCVLLHTDAAFSGQGVVSEILQLSGLAGYSVGGTIHLVINNQIGFTTEPEEGRTARYCTDIGKMIAAPIVHVNGDTPEAVARIAQMTVKWQQRFARDIFVDLVCYRRNGHNELDEPRFTQPQRGQSIDQLPPLSSTYAESVAARSPPAFAAATAAAARVRVEWEAGYEAAASWRPNGASGRQESWAHVAAAGEGDILQPVMTGVGLEEMKAAGVAASRIPDDISVHPKVKRFYHTRLETLRSGVDINFATAEALAFATLLAEGISVRLSGQDTVRGTFTQRHLAVHDMLGKRSVMPLAQAGRHGAQIEALNSPLSEYACLGFEYGHSTGSPDRLVIWEAQFGDFMNGAQIIVDQYIVSAEAKWGMMSGLVVMLPHGLEGQGPDHSSARIERILQLCAGGNVVVAFPSTPASLFHLLRRQIKAPWRKPLFVIAPKSLLRRQGCTSNLIDMADGTGFRAVLPDEVAARAPARVRRVILCSGKLFYDLQKAIAAAGLGGSLAVIRLEQLYPFPEAELRAALERHGPGLLLWCQEEPENQGALEHVRRQLLERSIVGDRHWRFGFVARPAMPVPAGGLIDRHDIEQKELIRNVLRLALAEAQSRTVASSRPEVRRPI